ncbi:MAG TPA: TRAP transporter substrate-binding protein [Bdellovibrionales bacterium]|nr:TRAP transporter substrate-binding protein [Bdellovibrionales bacterium]
MKPRIYGISIAVLILFVIGQAFSGRNDSTDRHHLLLAHNLTPDHPVHLGMEFFKRKVAEKSDGRIQITIYPSGQIGSEKEVLELVQFGAISMTKVNSLSLEAFSPLIGVLNVPFLFRDQAHLFSVLDGDTGKEILSIPTAQGLRGLTYYDAGDRSFYATKEIRVPDDVRGLKIRVMENATAIRMLQLLGGSPTPMPFGDVYTALQQGVIDGAENNISALTMSRHGEVAKFYSIVQHLFAPDILVISEDVWKKLSVDDQAIVSAAAEESKIYQREIWAKKLAESKIDAVEQMGVKIIEPDKTPFIERVRPLHDEVAARGPEFKRLIEAIRNQ